MPDKVALRKLIQENLDVITLNVNSALRGENIERMEHTLARVGRGGQTPHWFEQLKNNGTLPNLDGKTIGSVVEMLLVGVLESHNIGGQAFPEQEINPARGVDLPGLDLGIKSPSENYCTSEPYFSAYERLLGSEYDIIVFLTDYQTAKSTPPLRLQIIKYDYLTKTEVADANLCSLALNHRTWLLDQNESWAKKLFRFLAYVNQSDWRARQLVKIITAMQVASDVEQEITNAKEDFIRKNDYAARNDKEMIPNCEFESLKRILDVSPIQAGVIDALDNWVLEELKDAARAPSENEWRQFKASPLNGKIGMSFALQWRYNFGLLFR
jgi:hypothetical protein